MKILLLASALSLLSVVSCSESSASGTSGIPTTAGLAATVEQVEESNVDRIVSERVLAAFLDDRTLAPEARSVQIRTQEGVVHLSGQVSSETVKQRMGIVANAVGSVSRIVNALSVAGR